MPIRLIWDNFKKFMGEQVNPGDSISYVVPTCSSPVGGYAVGSLQDYMGLACGHDVEGMVGLDAEPLHHRYGHVFVLA